MTINPTIALWATNMARPVGSIEDWLNLVEGKLAEARDRHAAMLVMPEFSSAQWLHYKPAGLKASEEVAWMAAEGARALPALADLARRYGTALLAGTLPVADGKGGFFNRAALFFEDGRAVWQDKLCLTPSEKNPEAWNLVPGTVFRVISWRGLKLGILICLDSELPALSAAIADRQIDILLVPSMTAKPSGYHRVFGCAKARAVELQAIIAAVGSVGPVNGDTNFSGAAVFVPCEEALGFDGRFAEIAPADSHDGDGPMLVAADLPVDTVRKLRAGGAEVWPGAWRADRLTIEAA